MAESSNFDALLPPAMAVKAEELGEKRASLPVGKLFLLAVLAGAFIGLGALFATTVSAGGMKVLDEGGAAAFSTGLPFGLTRLLAGLAFSLGLILVVLGGAELFTGNALITMAFASHRITFWQVIRNWSIVYLGNLVGSILTAYIVFIGKQYTFGVGAVGLTALNIAESKTSLTFLSAVALGILCNALVCMAVWMTYGARSSMDKVMVIVPPIAAFVAAGFEHSVANMYFIPLGLFIKYWGDPAFFDTINKTSFDFPHLTWQNFIGANLVPVTIGNIIGGALMVGIVYWFIYRYQADKSSVHDHKE